jgi:uncharacterized protein (DUF1501 family)
MTSHAATSRRDFLKTSTLLGLGATVPSFLGRTALAADTSDKAGSKDTLLVVVQLTGGNDGLNTVIPFKDADYYKHRPTIAIPKDQVKKIGKEIGLHPAMDATARLLDERSAVCVVQGVGYPNPSQSHFRSMDIWQAGSTDATLTEGWLGKAMKEKSAAAFHLAAENEASPLALAGAPARVPSLTSLEEFQVKTAAASRADREAQQHLITEATRSSGSQGSPGLLDFVARTQLNTYASSDRLAAIGRSYRPKSPYPASPFANRLRLCAQLIDAGLGTRIFYVSLDGFDTHAAQGGAAGAHARLLRQLSDAISAFYRDMEERGHKDRLCVMTFSEFGRRVIENGSKGTDHGSGAPMFLYGGKVKAGLVGEHPSLSKLENGNLVHAIDFRRIYAAVLDRWLGIDSKQVLGAAYKPIELFT